MSRPIVLSADAELDLVEAALWFESRVEGLGVELIHRVGAVLDQICANPELYGEIYGRHRRAPVKRFPYGIFYGPRADFIEVVAIVHDHRDPVTWQSRPH